MGGKPPPGFPGGPSLLGLGAGCVVRAWGRVLGESAHPCRVVPSRWVSAPLVCTVLWLFMAAGCVLCWRMHGHVLLSWCALVCVCVWLAGWLCGVMCCCHWPCGLVWCMGAWLVGWLCAWVCGWLPLWLSQKPRRFSPANSQHFSAHFRPQNRRKKSAGFPGGFQADLGTAKTKTQKPKTRIKSVKPKSSKPKTQKSPKPAPNPQNPSRQNPKPTSKPPNPLKKQEVFRVEEVDVREVLRRGVLPYNRDFWRYLVRKFQKAAIFPVFSVPI